MTVVILFGGFVFVVFVLVRFGASERYWTPVEDLGPAEREWLAREAADLLAELASWAIVVVWTEREVEAMLRDQEVGVRVAVHRRLAQAGLRDFWRELVRGSGADRQGVAHFSVCYGGDFGGVRRSFQDASCSGRNGADGRKG